jgi:hypothetical protein
MMMILVQMVRLFGAFGGGVYWMMKEQKKFIIQYIG